MISGMKKYAAILLIALVAGCAKQESATTETSQGTTSVSTASTETTASTNTITPGTTAPTPTATETVAPAPPANVATTPGTPSATTSSAPPAKKVAPHKAAPATSTTAAPAATTTTAAAAAPPASTTTVEPSKPAPAPAATAPATNVAEGQTVFRSKCTGCHGADGKKPANGKVLASAEVQSKSDAELERILHEGAGKVSAMAHKRAALSDDQIRAVIAYIRTLK